MAMGARALDNKYRIGREERFIAQQSAQFLDLGCRPVAEIGEGAFADLTALAPTLAQQNRRA